MNVFVDFHHSGLLQSFILLFEKRLGGQVFRPIGEEWYQKGFWKVYDHPATVQQYLGIGGATPDGTQPLNEVRVLSTMENLNNKNTWVYNCQDIDSGLTNKAITYEGFMSLPFDLVIASLPQHIEPFKKLCELHPSKPKFIYQIGNAWNVEPNQVKNVMASALVDTPPGVNVVTYHQEFDLDVFASNIPQEVPKIITSFVNCFTVDDLFKQDYELFQEVERLMPEWSFKAYGGQCRDGAAHGVKEVAQRMRNSAFVWHTKRGGDGYGHIVFNTGAIARPMIVKKEYYRGKMGEKLMKDGETCIAIDGLSPQQIKEKVEFYSELSSYQAMCERVKENFFKEVDFEKEAENIKAFIANLV